jgi:hypothetical protein
MLPHEGSFSSPSARLAPSAARREPGAALRLAASLRWFSLDERLAAGEDPSHSALVAAQAARLMERRHRDRLAAALGGLLLAAERAPRISRVSPNRNALRRHETAVRELARRVESDQTVYARGLARLERLLSDSTGPAFRGGAGELAAELERIEADLSGRPSSGQAEQRAKGASRGASVRGLARLRSGSGAGPPLDPAGPPRGSFTLPDGSWFYGRRESS